MKLNFFLCLHPEDDLLFRLAQDVIQLEQAIEELGQLIDFLKTDKDVFVFYDSRDVSSALEHLEGLLDDPSRLTNPKTALRLILRRCPNVQDESQLDHQSSYFSWHYQRAEIRPENGNILAEIAERVINSIDEAKFIALILGDTTHNSSSAIPVFKDNNRDVQLPKFVLIEYVFGFSQAFNWLNKSRKPRNFNKNPKHGENGEGMRSNNGEKVSPLLGSKEDAHQILQTAIGCPGTTELYNFDDKNGRYLVFKFENEHRVTTYHGYHPENEAEVPASVRTWIEKTRLLKPPA